MTLRSRIEKLEADDPELLPPGDGKFVPRIDWDSLMGVLPPAEADSGDGEMRAAEDEMSEAERAFWAQVMEDLKRPRVLDVAEWPNSSQQPPVDG